MGEFRIGRKYAHHFYPDARKGVGPDAYARNFAMGPDEPASIATLGAGGTQIPWDYIESEGVVSTVDVPITPRVTGRILFKGVIVVKNNDLSQVDITVQVQVNGSTLSAPLNKETVDAQSLAAIPFEMTDENLFPVGTPANIQVVLTASIGGVVQVNVDSSTIEIQEVSLAS